MGVCSWETFRIQAGKGVWYLVGAEMETSAGGFRAGSPLRADFWVRDGFWVH